MDAPNTNDPIRITRDEALGGHVDDMLKRQMSLKGESGINRDRGRRWYYQNWFVFMFAGLIATVIAWSLLEPYMEDSIYIQDKITAVDTTPSTAGMMLQGTITVKKEKIAILDHTRWLRAVKSKEPREVDINTLNVGDEIGVYIDKHELNKGGSLAFAVFLVQSPKPQPPAEAAMTVDDHERRSSTASLLFFPVVAGLIGLFIGAVDGLVCRLMRRAVLGGLVGLLVGFVGGFISMFLAGIVYTPLTKWATDNYTSTGLSTFGFVIQITGRTIAWGLAGTAMGLGQGIALRSRRLLIYGLLGGIIGGLLGGLAFDPIDLLLLGQDKADAHWSRLIGLVVIGMSVGAMIGIVELLARDAWLRMTEGPLSGKEFLIFKDSMNVGSSPRSDIYLFNDNAVLGHHATLRAVGDECEIESKDKVQQVLVNSRPTHVARLRHGDKITIGRTSFVFEKRQG
jgi:hypothetical protein